MVVQTEDTSAYVHQDRLSEATQQAEPGPPPYESVVMSGYDGVCLSVGFFNQIILGLVQFSTHSASDLAHGFDKLCACCRQVLTQTPHAR